MFTLSFPRLVTWLLCLALINLTACSSYEVGETIDNWNNVSVYYNGSTGNTSGRHVTADGYNLGLKWQCVEFVKRYYYEHLNHQFPDSYGHAKDLFNPALADGTLNTQRGLLQFKNGGASKLQPDDIIIFDSNFFNEYGHVAIVTTVSDDAFEVIQQNTGTRTRQSFPLEKLDGNWQTNDRILGWLRLKP